MARTVSDPPRGDFASAAMVRVLLQGMADLGLPPPPLPMGTRTARPHVTLEAKRALLQHAVAHGGLGCLPLLGRGIWRFAQEPLHQALVSARDAGELLQRWSRLEAYVHSRHRVVLRSLAHGEAHLQHGSLVPGAPPQPAESLVVLGLLAALLEQIGLRAVQVAVAGAEVFPRPRALDLVRAVQQGGADAWHVRWRPPVRDAAPVARQAADGMPELAAAEAWPPVGKRVFHALLHALPAAPDVAALAGQLATSPRQLQRQLQQAGLCYAGLLAEARYRCAGWWLLHTALPLAEVGFLSGHADQPHLTRSFKQRSGMTPQVFRDAFGAAGG